MKKPIAAVAAVLLSGAVIFGGTTIANADDAPAPDTTQVTPTDAPTTAPDIQTPAPVVVTPPVLPAPKLKSLLVKPQSINLPPAPTYDAVLWVMDSYSSKYAQTKVSVTNETSKTLPDIPTTCGTAFQGDIYDHNDAEAAWLSSTDSLAGPDGAQDGPYLTSGGDGVAWTVVYNPACDLPVQPPMSDPSCIATPSVTLPVLPDALKYSLPDAAGEVISLAAGQTQDVVVHEKAIDIGVVGYSSTEETWHFVGADKVNDISCYPPVGCTVAGSPYTEDGFPAFTPDGLYNEGGKGHALNYLIPATGNLQGVTSQSETISSASGYQTAVRFVVYSNGTSGYTSVSAEPYMNGWVAGQTGVFTVTQDTLVWNSHISSGPGSQSDPIALSAMAALIPANQLLSIGEHYGSTEPDGTYTTVSSLSGCVSFSPPTKPEPKLRSVVTDGTPDCTNDTVEETTTNYETDYVFDATSDSYLLGTEFIASSSDVSVTLTGETLATDCPPTSTPTQTPTPTATPVVTTHTGTTPPEKVLGFTGVDATGPILVGGGLLFVGFILFLIRRSRRTAEK